MKKIPLIVLGIILICFGPLIVLTNTAYTLMLPNIYESKARIVVNDPSGKKDCENPCPHCSAVNSNYIKVQMVMLQSKPILYEVINRLNLQSEWGRDGDKLPRDVAYQILRRSISVSQFQGTTIITIAVRRTDPNEAAKIANEIAGAYRDSRLDLARQEILTAREKIQEVLEKQKSRVEAAEEEVNQLQPKIAIVGGKGDNVIIADPLRLKSLQADYIAAQREVLEKQELLKSLEKLDGKDWEEEIAVYTRVDPYLTNTVQEIKTTEMKMNEPSIADLGPNHPEMKRLIAAKETLEKKLLIMFETVRRGVREDYARAKNKAESLEKLLAGASTPENRAKYEGKQKAYRTAQEELKSERYIYSQMMAKLRTQDIKLEIPRHPVELIDIAEPNVRPVSPNLFTNVLVSVVLAVVCMVVGTVMLILGNKAGKAA